jgi:hypothetical protein
MTQTSTNLRAFPSIPIPKVPILPVPSHYVVLEVVTGFQLGVEGRFMIGRRCAKTYLGPSTGHSSHMSDERNVIEDLSHLSHHILLRAYESLVATHHHMSLIQKSQRKAASTRLVMYYEHHWLVRLFIL